MSPTLQSIWLAQSVEQDDRGRVTVSGMFDTMLVDEGMDYTSGAVIFFAVRGVHGRADLKLVYIDLADDETILLERDVRVEGTPLETTDVSVRINRIPAPHLGVFAWELFCGEERLGSTRVRAMDRQGRQE